MAFLRLVFYEMKKLFSALPLRVILVVMLLVNMVLLVPARDPFEQRSIGEAKEMLHKLYHEDRETFEAQYAPLRAEYDAAVAKLPLGAILEEPLTRTFSKIRNDVGLYNAVIQQHDSERRPYQEYLADMIAEAKRYEAILDPDSYLAKRQALLIESYEKLAEKVEFNCSPVYGWKEYLLHDAEAGGLLAVLLVVALLAALGDRTAGFTAISAPASKGGIHTAAAKFAASFLSSFVIALLFTLSSLFAVWVFYGLSDPTTALQGMNTYAIGHPSYDTSYTGNIPFALSFGGFAFVQALYKAFFAGVCGAFMMTLTLICRRYVTGALLSGGFVYLQYRMSVMDPYVIEQWKFFNIFSFYNIFEFWRKIRFVNLFGAPVNMLVLVPIALVLILLLLLALTILVYRRQNATCHSFALRSFWEKKRNAFLAVRSPFSYRGGTRAFAFELYKNKLFVIALVIVLAAKWFTAMSDFEFKNNSFNRLSAEYMETLEGTYSAEKAAFVETEYVKQQAILDKEREMKEGYENGPVSGLDYFNFEMELYAAKSRLEVLTVFQGQSVYLASLQERGILGSYLATGGIERYESVGADVLLLFFVMLFAANLFLCEFGKTSSRGAVISLVQTTKRGRLHLFYTKLLVIFCFTTVVFACFAAIDFYHLQANWWIPQRADLVCSLRRYEGMAQMTFGEYFVLLTVMRYAGVLLAALLAVCMTVLLKDIVSAYAALAAVVLIPIFAENTGILLCRYVNPANLTRAPFLFALGMGMFIAMYLAFALAVGVFTAYTAYTVKKGIKG